jgi:predicted amidophosphoribosyltransferase
LIHNFKKGAERRGRPEWRYKERSIREAAAAFSKAIHPAFLTRATLVPIPPSKARDDPRYDDRLVRMLRQMTGPSPLDIRELVRQNGTRETAAHDGARPGPEELAAIYDVDETVSEPAPVAIALFDDLLVTGASFVAAKRVLGTRYPDVPVYGFFLARRALPDPAEFFDIIEDT